MRASKRVAESARRLDGKMPLWYERVNPDTLDMTKENQCILGQLFHDRGRVHGQTGYVYALQSGFADGLRWSAYCPIGFGAYRRIQEAWTTEIEVRRSAAVVREATAILKATAPTTRGNWSTSYVPV